MTWLFSLWNEVALKSSSSELRAVYINPCTPARSSFPAVSLTRAVARPGSARQPLRSANHIISYAAPSPSSVHFVSRVRLCSTQRCARGACHARSREAAEARAVVVPIIAVEGRRGAGGCARRRARARARRGAGSAEHAWWR